MVMKRPMVAFLTQRLAIFSRFTRRTRLAAENLIHAPAAGSTKMQVPRTRETVEHRSPAVRMVVSTVSVVSRCDDHRSTGDCAPLAPTQASHLAALEVRHLNGDPRYIPPEFGWCLHLELIARMIDRLESHSSLDHQLWRGSCLGSIAVEG